VMIAFLARKIRSELYVIVAKPTTKSHSVRLISSQLAQRLSIWVKSSENTAEYRIN
jgi:hypothetical protein